MRTSRADAEDLIQEIYLEIIKNHFRLLRKFEGGNRRAFLVYLKRTAENVGKNFLRKILRDASELRDVLAEIVDERPNPESVMLAEADMSQLYAAIDGLRQEYRDVMRLLLKGYLHREIAEILNIPLATSLTHANRAQMVLKKILQIEIKSQPVNTLS